MYLFIDIFTFFFLSKTQPIPFASTLFFRWVIVGLPKFLPKKFRNKAVASFSTHCTYSLTTRSQDTLFHNSLRCSLFARFEEAAYVAHIQLSLDIFSLVYCLCVLLKLYLTWMFLFFFCKIYFQNMTIN